MAHLIEFASPSISISPYDSQSSKIKEEYHLPRSSKGEPIPTRMVNSGQQTRRRSQSDPTFDGIFKRGLNQDEIVDNHKLQMTPILEDTPALSYLATPSSLFSHESPFLISPVDQGNNPYFHPSYSSIFPAMSQELYHSEASIKSKSPVNGPNQLNALGLFYPEEVDDLPGSTLGSQYVAGSGAELGTAKLAKEREELGDVFAAIWKYRRPEDCRIYFQATSLCHMSNSVCPLCDNGALVGSYQCTTTMKPFPQEAINALLRHPSGGKVKRSQKKMARSGTMPYLHPITALEVCLLCANKECNMKEFKSIDRVAFKLPLKEENYQSIFSDWLFTEVEQEDTSFDELFDEAETF